MNRYCFLCKAPIATHVSVVDNKDFCGKACYCRYLGHRPKKSFCAGCRGPEVPRELRGDNRKRKSKR